MDKIGKCGLWTKFDIKDNMEKIRKYGQNWKIWKKWTIQKKKKNRKQGQYWTFRII